MPLRTRLGRIGEESGLALMEIVASAAVLAVVALSVLAGIDAALSSTVRESSRSVTAALAEQDQERLRATRVRDLPKAPRESTYEVDGVLYTVTSQAKIVNDATGATENCMNEQSRASYLQLSSTAKPKDSNRGRAVTLTSLVASHVVDGFLVVQLNDRDARPVVGMPVTVSGPDTRTDSTNAEGCALFGPIESGDYVISLTASGWANISGQSSVEVAATVNPGKVSTKQITYDRLGTVDVSVNTHLRYRETREGPTKGWVVAERKPLNPQADEMHSLTAAHPDIPTTRMRSYAPDGVAVDDDEFTVSAPTYRVGLFPFKSPYGFHGGRCSTQHAQYPEYGRPTYFDTWPGRVQVDPAQSYAVTIREPSLNLTVLDTEGERAPNNNRTRSRVINVVLTPYDADDGCTEKLRFKGEVSKPTTTQIWPRNTTLPDGHGGTMNVGGMLRFPGVPYGKWTVCVDDGTDRIKTPPVVSNLDPAGSDPFVVDLDLPANRASGTCA